MTPDLLATVANPFPGLRPFEAHETHLFFGRDTATRELLRRLQRARFLAVVGSSGSGKSSLVRAGMLPALRGGLMRPPGSAWRIAVLRPGDRPIAALAEALASADALGFEAEAVSLGAELIETTLRRSSLGLVQAVRQARIDPDAAVLVVVDQFEELFRFHRLSRERDGGDEAAAFVALLLEAARQREVPIYVVLTMRSDFLGDCAVFRDLPEAINDGQYLIPRFTRDQLREAIAGPIAVGGGEITPRLLQRLLNDVGDNPDQLPILQHALMRTWERWRGEAAADAPVDLHSYEAIGGMADALNRHAEEAYGALAAGDREIARRLFQRISERGPDNREIRRPTTLRDVCTVAAAPEPAVIAVIDRFREGDRTFVMPPAGEPLDADSVIDISHESLIRLWDRLRGWVEDESASAARYRRLAEDAVRHEAGEVDLWRDPQLSLALAWQREEQPNAAWARRYHPAFESAMRFLDESRRERDRRVFRRRAAIAVLAVAAVGFAALAFVAFKQQQAAERQRARADEAVRNLEASAVQLKRALEVAEQQRSAAETATARAESEAQRATDALADAKTQRDAAQTQRARAEAETTRANAALAEARTQRDAAQTQRARAEAEAVRASNALAEATRQRDAAEAERRRAEVATEATRRALAEAEQQRDLARAATQRAEQEAERAGRALGEAQRQRDTAARLRTTGLARQLVAEASLLQRDAPNRTDLITLLAAESLRRTPLYDNDRLLREVLYLQRPLVAQRTAGAPVMAVAWSPDGRRIAGVTRDDSVVVWPYPGNESPLRLRHDKPVRAIAWSSDSRRLAVAGEDRAVRIRDADSGRELERLGHGGTVVAVAWSLDGRLLASASRDRTVRVWEAGSGRERHRFRRESPPVALALSADGTRVAAADEDEVVVVWDTQTGKEVRTLPSYGRVDALAWSPDGHLAAGYTNWAVRVWDMSSGRQRGPVLMHQYPVTSLAWSADGQYLASGSNDRTARLWEPESGHELARLPHDDNVSGVTWSRLDARLLATSGVEGQIRVWNTLPSDGSRRLVHDASIGKVTATADARIVATSSGEDERILRMWDATIGQQLFRVTHDDRVQALGLAPDGRMLAAGTKGGDVLVIDATGRERARLTHGGPVLALAWSADSQRLASAGEEGRPIVLWDVGSRRVLNRLAPASNRVSALAWSPDGQQLASGGDDQVVRVWNAATGAGVALGKHDNPVFVLAWSADGRRLASGGGDRSARLWDPATRSQVVRLPHSGRVMMLSWSAAGARIMTFSGKAARIWNGATGEELIRATLPGGVRAATLRADGKALTTVSEVGRTVVVEEHTLEVERLLALACTHLPRNLTEAEWKEYVGEEARAKTCPNLP